MKRSKLSLSHYKLLTGNPGNLIPCGLVEVLPGDSMRMASSVLLRVSPLLAPVMHPFRVRVHHWFVPARLLWSGWEKFITGGNDGEGDGVGSPPTLSSGGSGFSVGSLADYLGVPTGADAANLTVSALPFRAYNKIFNEYYRDQDLVSEVAEDSTTLQRVAWEKDYFTTARPWPQRGPSVSLPISGLAPVTGIGTIQNLTGYASASPAVAMTGQTTAQAQVWHGSIAFSTATQTYAKISPTLRTPEIYADLSQADALDVRDVRMAFALQRYQEARAQWGARYVEYLRYLGIRPSDARLQRPEYLGGGKTTIAFSEVLQTGVTTDGDDSEGVGNLKGHGIAALRSRRFMKFFEEHGYIVSLLSVIPRNIYVNSLDRMWSRTTKEDYFQRELEQVGQQELYRREIFAQSDANGGSTVFGYQDRYAEYRHQKSRVSGDFRTLLNFWHEGRDFMAAPTLNQSFIECNPSNRIYAVPSEDVLWCMVNHNIQARRMVSKFAKSRVL